LKSNNVEFLRYCGGHFENGDRYKFFEPDTKFEIVNFYYWNVLIINNHMIIWLFQKTISSCQVSLAWPGLQICSSSTWWRRKQSLAGLGDFIIAATLLINYINHFTIFLCYLKLTVYSNFKFSLTPSTIWMNVIWRWILWYIA
jgi:hypothetical protein